MSLIIISFSSNTDLFTFRKPSPRVIGKSRYFLGRFHDSKLSTGKYVRLFLVQILNKVQKSVYAIRKISSTDNLLYNTLYLGQGLITSVSRDIAWKSNLEDVLKKTKGRLFVVLQFSERHRGIVKI
jgi:hypothetical protein